MDEFLKKSIQVTLICAVVLSIALLFFKKVSWSMGLLVAAAWSIANFLLTLKVIKIAVLEKTKSQLNLFLIVKFPVLYLFGFLILVSRVFPVWSLLTGLSLMFIVMGVLKICPKLA